jgi:hypothetical protein
MEFVSNHINRPFDVSAEVIVSGELNLCGSGGVKL